MYGSDLKCHGVRQRFCMAVSGNNQCESFSQLSVLQTHHINFTIQQPPALYFLKATQKNLTATASVLKFSNSQNCDQ